MLFKNNVEILVLVSFAIFMSVCDQVFMSLKYEIFENIFLF